MRCYNIRHSGTWGYIIFDTKRWKKFWTIEQFLIYAIQLSMYYTVKRFCLWKFSLTFRSRVEHWRIQRGSIQVKVSNFDNLTH